MEEALVMLPSPAIGHLISLIELAKLILTRHPSFSIHILLPPAPYTAGSTSSYISSTSTSFPSIKFHHLPTNFIPPDVPPVHKETLVFRTLRHSNPHVYQSLAEISRLHTVRGFIVDAFGYCAIEIASQFKIPFYFYITSPAGCLSFFAYLSTLHYSDNRSFREIKNTVIHIPGIPPIAARDFPEPVQDRDDEAYVHFLNFSETITKAAGILVNTFEALEVEAIKSWRSGQCIPENPTPPLYCIGPLLMSWDRGTKSGDECLKWLDLQREKSVVFLSFGSLGVFTKEQIEEIAVGLEKSGQSFLWVVRSPPSNEEVDTVLPEGFLERTKGKGLIVRNWAPQVEILNHAAVGGFVTHCGWNSVLEGLCAGVPIVAWPLYAEQRLNRVLIVEGSGIAVPMEGNEDGFVSREEVETKVKEIMNGASGEIRRRACDEIRDAARKAVEAAGSSSADLEMFVNRHLSL